MLNTLQQKLQMPCSCGWFIAYLGELLLMQVRADSHLPLKKTQKHIQNFFSPTQLGVLFQNTHPMLV